MAHSFLAPEQLLASFPIATGMSVGECGVSGSGNMMTALSTAVGPDGKVFEFDINKNVLSALASQARLRNLPNIFPVWTDLEVIGGTKGIADQQLDAAVAVHLFHESSHHVELLAELHRMLKPSAPLLVVDWTKESQHPLAPTMERRLAAGYFSQLATSHGFSMSKQFAPDEDHWGIILTTT